MRIGACLLGLSLMAFAAGAAAQTTVDYDTNNNNLIDVTNQAQLQAITHDLTGVGGASATDYTSAFPNAMSGMGCRTTCAGYELRNDITLSGGWSPIGGGASIGSGYLDVPAVRRYKSVFEGNGYIIRDLNLVNTNDTRRFLSLFSALDTGGVIRNVGMVNVSIDARHFDESGRLGALVGDNDGTVAASYVVGGSVTSDIHTGGLVGQNAGTVIACYANVQVTGAHNIGGLVGINESGGRIVASYALGRVVNRTPFDSDDHPDPQYGGLVGGNSGTIENSYSASDLRGITTRGSGVPSTSVTTRRALYEPTAATGIFAAWKNLDVDGDGMNNDNPWDFGTLRDYPALRPPHGDAAALREQRSRHSGPGAAQWAVFYGRSGPVVEGSAAAVWRGICGRRQPGHGDDELVGGVHRQRPGSCRGVRFCRERDDGAVATVTGNSPVVRVATRDDGMPDGIESFRVRVTSWQGVVSTASDARPRRHRTAGTKRPRRRRRRSDRRHDDDAVERDALRRRRCGHSRRGHGGRTVPRRGPGRIGVSVDVADVRAYESAFPSFSQSMTCPTTNVCTGYELLNDLDFNTGDAAIRSDDLYWNGGRGWDPVDYAATFDGNGHVISNLYIDSIITGGAQSSVCSVR